MDVTTVIKQYRDGKSPYEIAEFYRKAGIKCYPNKIRRLLIKNGIELRDKSEAQKEALSSGRVSHPTKGRHRTQEEKLSISKTISEMWDNMPDEEKCKRAKISKDKWDKMTAAEKEALRSAAAKAIRDTVENGSKIEKFLLYNLRRLDYRVDFHTRNLLSTQKLQVDLFLPDLGVAIEVDGPSHYEPVWGQEALERTQWADQEKNGLLLGRGYCVIRLRTTAKNISIAYQQGLLDKILKVLYNIEEKGQLPIEERLIYVE